jgi:S1-C subfamily serine protease
MSRSLLTKVLISLVTVAVVIGAFTSFQRKRSSFERLDFKSTRVNGVIVVQSVDRGSEAEKAGLRVGDRIWLIGDTPSTEVRGLRETLRRSGTVPMVIARGNETLTVQYRAPE